MKEKNELRDILREELKKRLRNVKFRVYQKNFPYVDIKIYKNKKLATTFSIHIDVLGQMVIDWGAKKTFDYIATEIRWIWKNL